MLVAVVMLFVVGAMAALSIDVVTIYTARSEAQLAADAAALAAARVIANSGATSDSTGTLLTSVEASPGPARTVAIQVAEQNQVGGANLTGANITFSGPYSNPTVTVSVQVTNLPTFFARIWGTKFLTVGASATAEAYNPSGSSGTPPVAPMCVKPWLLPNIDPTQPATATAPPAIFNSDGSIVNPGLVGQGWPSAIPALNQNGLFHIGIGTAPVPGRYYAGVIDADDFPEPTQALPACSAGFSTYPYMVAIAGCVPRPISCGAGATINIATGYASKTGSRNGDTVEAAECLIHYDSAPGDTDSIDATAVPSPPLQFRAGAENPVVLSGALAAGADIMVSDSLVTIPVYNSTTGTPPTNPVTVIGFLQVFLNPAALSMPQTYAGTANQIPVTIVNMAGCGTAATGTPILGNGASPVTVRLISPP